MNSLSGRLIFSKNVNQVSEYSEIVSAILSEVSKGSSILLEGDLGAGKTTFISAFCRHLGVQVIQSPTYAIHQRYQSEKGIIIDHFDLYRLETEDQLESAGIYDLLSEQADYKFIEWSQRMDLESLISLNLIYKIKITVSKNEERLFELFKIK